MASSNSNALDKIKSVDWRGLVRSATNKVKQYAMNLSPLEVQVEEATNLDTWGPHGTVMAEIAEACYDPEGYRQVLGILAKRFQEKDERWRMCYKALLLLEYLVKHGPLKVAQDVANSSSVLTRLQHFQYKDANGKDHGINVRHRATEILELVSNRERLEEERNKAAENKAKYTGVSAAQMRSGYGFGNAPSNRTGGFDRAALERPGQPRSEGFRSGGFGSSRGHVVSMDSSRTSPPLTTSSSFGSDAMSGLGRRDEDPIVATQDRIAKMKLQEAKAAMPQKKAADEGSKSTGKKKLSDVRANPKIAKSLGLKLPTGSAQKPKNEPTKPAGMPEAGTSDLDLLGTLEVPSVSETQGSTEVERNETTSADAWNPFEESNPVSTLDQAPVVDASISGKHGPLPADMFSDFEAPKSNTGFAPGSTSNDNTGIAFDPFSTSTEHQEAKKSSAANSQVSASKDPFADLLA